MRYCSHSCDSGVKSGVRNDQILYLNADSIFKKSFANKRSVIAVKYCVKTGYWDGKVGACLEYIEPIGHAFSETVEICQRSVYIDVSQTENSIIMMMQMKTMDNTLLARCRNF